VIGTNHHREATRDAGVRRGVGSRRGAPWEARAPSLLIAGLALPPISCVTPSPRSAAPISSVEADAGGAASLARNGVVDGAAPLGPSEGALLAVPPTSAPTSDASAPLGGCPAGMASIDSGVYRMGELGTIVTVRPFCLDLTEVTSGAYAQCVEAHHCSDEGLHCGAAATYGVASKRNHPINCVTWAQADKFCRAAKKRLPTEEEWEWAARGGEEARNYPWREGSAEGKVCWSGGTKQREETCAVGEFPAGDAASRIHDLAGNVWEWTASAYNKRDATRVNKGGGFISNRRVDLHVSNRYADDPTNRTVYDGFRCAK
jgi:sulfatase modifying factor 1